MRVAYLSELSPSRRDRHPRDAELTVIGSADSVWDCSVGQEAVVSLEDVFCRRGGRGDDGGRLPELEAHDRTVGFGKIG